jgi:hypothetical protein
MAISTAMCTSFKSELMSGLHDFDNPGGNTFKIALFTSTATLGASTTAYSSTDEVANGNGYTTGGEALTSVSPTTSGTTAYVDFADVTWSASTITANGALIYNNTNANRAAVTLAFGSDKSSSNGDFQIVFPTANATDAIIRIA